MKFDFSEATKSLHELLRGVLDRLPYISAAFVVFVIFFLIATSVRALVSVSSPNARANGAMSASSSAASRSGSLSSSAF